MASSATPDTRSSGSIVPVGETSPGVEILTAPVFAQIPWLCHGFSVRQGGVSEVYGAVGELNLGFTAEDERARVETNRFRFVQAVTGSRDTSLVTVRQVHSNRTVEAQVELAVAADGIVTGRPGLLVGILTADCIPVLVADRRRRLVGAFHAGWRGTVDRIVELGVQTMREMSGQAGEDGPEDLVAAIGPGIGPCCYAVGEEVHDRFLANFKYGAELFKRDEVMGVEIGAESVGLRLDLIEANRRQLLDAGVAVEAISVVGGCTQCRQNLFYSHRGSSGRAGRMMAAIGIR